MKQNSIYFIGLCALLFSACAKEDLPVADENRGNETEEVTFSFSFDNAFQTGTDYEPMTKSRDGEKAIVSNTYHYYVVSDIDGLDKITGYNIEAHGTALFDKTKGPDELITLHKGAELDPLTLVLPAYMPYYCYISTGGNKQLEWVKNFKNGEVFHQGDEVLLYKEQVSNTATSEYLSDSFSGEILLGWADIWVEKTSNLPEVNKNPFKIYLDRGNTKFRVLLKDTPTASGKTFSDYTDGDIFIYLEFETIEGHEVIPIGIQMLNSSHLPKNQKETLRYCTSVSQSYQATTSEDKFYISIPNDKLFAPFIPSAEAIYSYNHSYYKYRIKNLVCESVNSAGETVRFTYEVNDKIFEIRGNYTAIAFELTDEEIEPGNYKLVEITKDNGEFYKNEELQELFSPDFEYSFLN